MKPRTKFPSYILANDAMNISIFARPYFISEDPDTTTGPYLHRGTSYIRGEQIASYLGGKYNPKDGFDHDICIYLKPKPQTFNQIKDGSYVDFSDAEPYLKDLLKTRPKIKVITSSLTSFHFLKDRLENEVFLIPEHHSNFEKTNRTRKEITTGGIITNPSAITYPAYQQIKNRLAKIGFGFITCYDWKTRQNVVDFYSQIDFQVIGLFGVYDECDPFRHPTKIINAASYGIPTVANWQLGYQEFEGNYIPVRNIDELVKESEKLKDPDYYQQWSKRIIEPAQSYHISKIARLYEELR